MALVEMCDLTIRYGSRLVIESFTDQLPAGQITALVGPSGSGKSTLLSTVNRMTDMIPNCHVSGDVRVDGKSVYDSRVDTIELRRRVGMVFQQPTPFPLTIRRNLSLPLRELGLSRTEIETRVESALTSAALWDEVSDRLDAPACELSGGQQQRLCVARALALDPQVLLLDEPCSALDQESTEQVEQTLQSLSGRVTLVIATHNLAQAARISDHVIDLANR